MPNSPYFVTSKFRIALFYLYLVAIGVLAVFVIRVVLDNARTADEAHRGLCTLKVERERRVAETQDYLTSTDPDKVAIVQKFGRPILVRSLRTAQADARALKDVSC